MSEDNSEIKPFCLLLVEDDDDHAKIVERCLKRGKFRCDIQRAKDGVEALRYLTDCGEENGRPFPNLVLLDLNLPKMSGHEVLRQIKSHVLMFSIPVIILSTSNTVADKVQAYRNYANSYLLKPLDAKSFARMVEDLASYWGNWNRPC